MNNNSYYANPVFPGPPVYSGNMPTPNQETAPGILENDLPLEQSYIENILRLNKGKKVTVYATYPDSTDWRDTSYIGIIEQSGRDHIILSDPATGKWYLILMIYVNFVEFDERINYSPEFEPI